MAMKATKHSSGLGSPNVDWSRNIEAFCSSTCYSFNCADRRHAIVRVKLRDNRGILMSGQVYNSGFFLSQKDGSLAAARAVLPFVVDVLRPHSVVDVGCGVGTWAAAASQLGVPKILGLDGDYVDRSQLLIPQSCFRAVDLGRVDETHDYGKFDLAISLEVAEHIDRSRAEPFVRFVANLAPTIMFGAAIPGQGGTNHVNEAWPSYWIDLFARVGYEVRDVLRPQIWSDVTIPYWYRQNSFLFVKKGCQLELETPKLAHDVVHPLLFERKSELLTQALSRNRELEQQLERLAVSSKREER